MQPASHRVKTIYSVIASPNRLEILRILNTKGPLSYSELKTLAGFKSKKESGKFAYHLRKLVRQMLISLNRSERRYTVTNLGRLVINLTRQIEEQTVIESGKLYVRTSRQTMEEFNADRILQSLVREAGMPVELAQKITSETEARLYKFQTSYLTAPLIREIVNALLIEHGYEEYRHKLTRLGLPVFDVTELISKTGGAPEDIETVLTQTAHSVFSEYLLLSQLPRDVADAHLAGEIHISHAGTWGLIPDTLFIDLLNLQTVGISLRGKLMTTPRISPPTTLEEAGSALTTLAALLTREASVEISLQNFLSYFHKFASGIGYEELRSSLRKTLTLVAGTASQSYGKPLISLQISKPLNGEQTYDDTLLNKLARAALAAYQDYVENVSQPRIAIVLALTKGLDDREIYELVGSITRSGGWVAMSTSSEEVRAFSGLKKDITDSTYQAESICALHSLSVNLPRLAHESNRDETYFRAKLALLLQLSMTALKTRRKIIEDLMKKGVLPSLTHEAGILTTEYMPLYVNLTGLNEATLNLAGERAAAASRRNIIEKTVETSLRVVNERADKLGEKAGVSIIKDDASMRFATLDAEKYGRSVSFGKVSYSDVPVFQQTELDKPELVEDFTRLQRKLTGGFAINLQVPEDADKTRIAEMIGTAREHLEYFRLQRQVSVCRNCGSKVPHGTIKCPVCKSLSLLTYNTA